VPPSFGSGPAGPRRNGSDNGHQLHQRRPAGDGVAGMMGPTDFAMREPSDENVTTLMVGIMCMEQLNGEHLCNKRL
jgi:hypothetical protein